MKHWQWDFTNRVESKLDTVIGLLKQVLDRETKIMATEQQLLDAIAKIDAATTKQGQTLQQEADTLQKVSDEIDKLIAGGVKDTTLGALQAQADKIQAISDSLDKQAAFSTVLASKADNPVPIPPPGPTP